MALGNDPGLHTPQSYEQQTLAGTANNIWQAIQALVRTTGNLDQDMVAQMTALIAQIAAQQTVVAPSVLGWVSINTSQTVAATNWYAVSTTGGAVTATLPASPTTNSYLYFADADGTFGTNNLTIGRNGHTINGSASDLVLNTNGAFRGLVYTGATPSWRTFSS